MKLNKILNKLEHKEPIDLRTKNELLQISSLYNYNKKIYGYEIIIRITYKCNLNCEFCFVNHKAQSFDNEKMNILINGLSKINLKGSRIVLSGGEPTIHPRYFEFLNKLEKTSARIVTQTNALIFSNIENVKKLKKSNEFFISFPSALEAEYNKITRSNKFNDFLKGASNLSENNFIELNHVLYKKNYKNFESLLALIQKTFNLKNTRLLISNLGLLNKFDNRGKLVKYSEIIKSIKEPYNKYKTNIKIEFTMTGGCGFPLCILNKIKNVDKGDYFKANKNMISYEGFDKQFYKNKKCLNCKYNEFCQGFPSIYTYKFGDSEIEPI